MVQNQGLTGQYYGRFLFCPLCLLKTTFLLSVVLSFAAGTFYEPNGLQSAVLEIYYEYK